MESVNQGSRRSPEIGLAGSRALPRDRLAAMLCHRGCAEIRCATRSRSLEEGSYAALCHSAIRVRLSREGRPSGFHHEFGLIVGRCDGCELAKLLGAGYIGLLASETDRDQRRRDRGIRLLHCHFVRRAAGGPPSPVETHDHGENATDDGPPDPCLEPRALHSHGTAPEGSKRSGSGPLSIVDQSPLRSKGVILTARWSRFAVRGSWRREAGRRARR